jgi:putative aldouronate transport system substrate-binding protein
MKKTIAWFLLIAMAAMLLAGCGSQSTETPAETPTQSESAAPAEESTAPVESAPAAEAETETAAPDSAEEAESPAEPESTFAEGAGTWPISEEQKTISIWDGWFPFFAAYFSDYNDTLFFQTMEEITNVHVEFTLVNAEMAASQFNLMVTSGDYCDLIHDVDQNYVGGVDKAWEDEVILDITDLIDTWMPNYKAVLESDPAFLEDAVSDLGNIYQFHNVKYDAGFPDYGLMIRQDWLDQLGMERPQTYDEYYEVLTAFKNEIGASAPLNVSNNGGYQGNFFASGYGIDATTVNSSRPFYQVDGQVKFGPMEEGYRDYLEMMAKWYREGLIYQDFMSNLESNTMPPDDLVLNDQMGVFGANITDIAERYTSVMGDNSTLRLTGAYDPTLEKGDVTHFGSDNGASVAGGYSVSSQCQDLETVARWADYIYTDEGQLLSNYGVEGVSFDYQEDGTPKLADVVLHNPDMPTMLALTKYTTFSLVGVEDPYRMYAEFTDDQWEAGEIWSMADDLYAMPSGVNMTTEETEVFSAKYSDIATYVSETTLKVIMGEKDIDAIWDEYVGNIQSMGIQDCLDVQQAALDRYYEK